MAAERQPARVFDAIEGVPSPAETVGLIGQDRAEAELLDAYRSARMHHAWILAGQKGVGKATLAYRFARFVLAHPDPTAEPCRAAQDLALDPGDPVSTQVAAGGHPNLLVLQRRWNDETKRFTTGIPVEDVRRVLTFFGSTAGHPGWRICLVDAADDLGPNAANALLKTLEEPPRRALFLLVSNTVAGLMPTIRSRCRTLALADLSAEAVRAVIEKMPFGRDGDPKALDAAVSSAGGSVRPAIRFLTAGGQEVGARYDRILADLTKAGDPPQADCHAVADLVARGGDDLFEVFLDLTRRWLTERVHREVGGTARAVVRWALVWEKVDRSRALGATLNLDRKATVLGIVRALSAAAKER